MKAVFCVVVCVALIGVIALNTRAELRAVWMGIDDDAYLIGELENTSSHRIIIDRVACVWSHGHVAATSVVNRAFTNEYESVWAIAPHECVPVLVHMDSLRPPGKLGKRVLGLVYRIMGDPKQRMTRAPARPGY